jgi:hypothetical protein
MATSQLHRRPVARRLGPTASGVRGNPISRVKVSTQAVSGLNMRRQSVSPGPGSGGGNDKEPGSTRGERSSRMASMRGRRPHHRTTRPRVRVVAGGGARGDACTGGPT